LDFYLIILVPPSVIDEDSSPSQLSVRENVRVSLLCRGRGVPAPRVNWKREDGRPLIEGKTGNHQMENSSGVTKRGGSFTTTLFLIIINLFLFILWLG
jgi:hypothetical protein